MSNLSNLAFLILAVIVSVVGSLIVVARHRKPSSLTTSIDDFSQRMQALAPEPTDGAADADGALDADADSDTGGQ